MDIYLSNILKNMLKVKVAKGFFKSMEEAITFAIQFTFVDNEMSKERIELLNADIEKGWRDMELGLGRNSDVVFEDLRKKYV